MIPRFTLKRDADAIRIVFDDGAMNLLSSDALRELRDVVLGVEQTILSVPTASAGRIACATPSTVVTFASARPGLFAAGADMAEMAHFTPSDAEAFSKLGQDVMRAIETLPATTIALIDGDCFGGALDLALAFDRRHATPRSRFSHPGARLGIVTGFGGTTRWRKVMTLASARQLFLANRVFSAEEAAAMGLVEIRTRIPLP